MAIQLLKSPLYIRSVIGGFVLYKTKKLAKPAFHMDVITSMKCWILPLKTARHAYLSHFCINKQLAVSGRPLLSGVASFSSVIFPDAESKESSIIYGAGWSDGGEGVKISVWWDFENCNVPNGLPAHKLSSNIVSALRMSGFKGPVTIAAYGDTLQLSRSVQEALSSTGIQIHHIPSGGKESDSSDRALLVDLILWTMDNPSPAHLFLISGDRDFSNALHRLRMRNYNILLACPTGAHLSTTLVGAASNVWQWNSLVRGEGLLARSCFDSKPSDGPSGGSFSLKGLNNNPKAPDASSGSSGGTKNNNNVKIADGILSVGMPKVSMGNSKLSDVPSGGGQTLKSSSLKISAPPSPSAWNTVPEDVFCKLSTQSKFEPINIPSYSEEKSSGRKLEKSSEEKLDKGSEEKQDNVLERTSKMEQSVPSEVLQQLDDLLKSHPEGIWMVELQPLMGEFKLQFDSDYYGHKKLVPFLLTIPEIVRVERRIAKDRKTWTYFLLSSHLPSKKSQRSLGDSSQLVPTEISKQLIDLLKSHPNGLWLNEFQAQLAAREIEFDSDFYGHHKMVPFLLTMPEIVRVERRLMNDKKTWTFFICSQELPVNGRAQLPTASSLARPVVAKGVHDPLTSENDVKLKLKDSVCKEKLSKTFQVEGLEKNQDHAFIEPSQEPGGDLDTNQSGREKHFWKRPWRIFNRFSNEHLEEHGFVSCEQATRNSGSKNQAGRISTEETHANQQTPFFSGILKRLFKGSGKDAQNAKSTWRSKVGDTDARPFGESLENGHISEKSEKAEDLNTRMGSQNPNLDSPRKDSHPKNSIDAKRDGKLGGDHNNVQSQAIKEFQSNSVVLVKNAEEKNPDGNHRITWKGFLLRVFKASQSPMVGSNDQNLAGIVVEKKSHPVLRSDKLHERHAVCIVETGQRSPNSIEISHPDYNAPQEKVYNGSQRWKKVLFGNWEEAASLAIPQSDVHFELAQSQSQKCMRDTPGVHQESHSQIQSSMKTVNARSSKKAADKNSNNEVCTTQGSANTSSLLVSKGEEQDNPCPSKVFGQISHNQTYPKVVKKFEDQVVCNDVGSSQEALFSTGVSQKTFNSPKEDTQVLMEDTKNLKKTAESQECCSLAAVEIDKASPCTHMPESGLNVLPSMEELSTQSKGAPFSLAAPCIKALVDSESGVEESSVVAENSEVRDHDRETQKV